jgi:hypothetical protein
MEEKSSNPLAFHEIFIEEESSNLLAFHEKFSQKRIELTHLSSAKFS